MVRFKEECSPHRIDCPLGRKPGGGTQAEEKPYETLRADCMEKGWICHVIPIEVGCYGFLGHSVILFLSKIGIIGRSLKVALYRLQTTVQYASSWIGQERKVFSMNEMHRESPFPRDYVTSRNGYCKCIMTSTAKSKCVLKITNCTKNEDECTM